MAVVVPERLLPAFGQESVHWRECLPRSGHRADRLAASNMSCLD